jgi:protein-(glutamine-N5) methyltransferase, release factor-specific
LIPARCAAAWRSAWADRRGCAAGSRSAAPHTFGVPRSRLYSGGLTAPEAEILERLDALVARRLAGEPLAYLLGDAEFHTLRLAVGPGVLTPRGDTELLVDWALERLAGVAAPTVVDAGTGSGCIALALALARDDAHVVALERSAAARHWAARNVAELAPGRVMLVGADWLQALAADSADLVVANPPYVRVDDARLDPAVARFEPAAALYAGADGLRDLRRLCAQAPKVLRAGGWLLLEHAPDQGQAVHALLADAGFTAVETRNDLAGRPRASGGRRQAGE